jgi:hypothetical protein
MRRPFAIIVIDYQQSDVPTMATSHPCSRVHQRTDIFQEVTSTLGTRFENKVGGAIGPYVKHAKGLRNHARVSA